MVILTKVYSHWPKIIYSTQRIWKDNIDIEIPQNGHIDQSLFTLTEVYSKYSKNMER